MIRYDELDGPTIDEYTSLRPTTRPVLVLDTNDLGASRGYTAR